MSQDEQPPEPPRRPTRGATRWETFAGWHRDPATWREMYVRTASALAAALVIYTIAALSGAVTKRPLVVVGGLIAVGSISLGMHALVTWRRERLKVLLFYAVSLTGLGLALAALSVALY